MRCLSRGLLSLLLLTPAVSADADRDAVAALAETYNRANGRVMVRWLQQPTPAAIDYAAWHHNPLLQREETEPLKPPEPAPTLADLTFGGALVADSLVDDPAAMPLTEAERAQPMAVPPLLEELAGWDYDRAEGLLRASAMVDLETWGTEAPYPTQALSTAWLHEGAAGTELWVELEFEPTAAFVAGVTDDDGDGWPEAYGRVDPAAVSPALVSWIRDQYQAPVLSAEATERRFAGIVGVWYPTHRTYLLDDEMGRPWPNDQTEEAVLAELAGRVIERPTIIIRGEPHGRAIYNVFVIAPDTAGADGDDGLAETDWAAQAAALAPFRADVRRLLNERPEAQKGIIGRDGFLFFRGSLDYLLADDLREQPDQRDPYPAIVDYKQQLAAKGIDLLVVVLPAKPEIYPDKLSDAVTVDPTTGPPIVQPYTRKLLAELNEAGVETVDLLPAFLAARAAETPDDEPFYMPLDTHWSNPAVRLAAHLIAERVRQYRWFTDLPGEPAAYTTREVLFTRPGDIRAMLSETEKLQYRPMRLTAQQVVRPDGTLYEDDPDSPIVLLGDSFAGVFQQEEPGHAGLSAHLARELGRPVDLIAAHGSGPRIRGQLARRGAEAVARKKLVIWTVVARDLYHYWAPWENIPVP